MYKAKFVGRGLFGTISLRLRLPQPVRVKVEHVHVNAGGQAVIGNVKKQGVQD
jgi:hypothetical protein